MTTSKRKRSSTGPSLAGSQTAKRHASVILEVLSGVRGPQEGSEAMGVSANRYYQLEARALAGLIAALEPRPKGKQQTPQRRIAALESENRTLRKELTRQQSLLRAAQRSLGVPQTPKRGKLADKAEPGKPKRRRRGVVRGLKIAKALSDAQAPKPAAPEVATGGE